MWQPFDARLISQPVGFEKMPTGWLVETALVPSHDPKRQLFCYRFRRQKPGTSRGLFLIHGMGEHAARYLHLTHWLNETVDEIVLYDQRGHGRSQGPKGHIPHFDDLVDDAKKVIESSQILSRHQEVHLLGHSMGGHVGLRLWLRGGHGMKSAIFSAPFLEVKQKVPELKKAAAKVMRHVWGGIQLHTGILTDGLSRVPELIQHYVGDALNHDLMTPQFYGSMVECQRDTRGRASELKGPVLFVIPLADPIVDSEITLEFARAATDPSVKISEWPESKHESMNDLDRAEVFARIKKFLESGQ